MKYSPKKYDWDAINIAKDNLWIMCNPHNVGHVLAFDYLNYLQGDE